MDTCGLCFKVLSCKHGCLIGIVGGGTSRDSCGGRILGV